MRFSRIFRALFLAAVVSAIPAASFAEISISVNIGPPALPVYEQPLCPGDGYIWTPGYWAWGPDGYFWVPGTWVVAPAPGLLWTPGYWGWVSSVYVWHPGYWGPHVGFYGGVNYGYGYTGSGYWGGRWEGNHFSYNRVVNNINVTNIHNVYVDKTVVVNNNVNRVSFNGGPGGVHAAPTPVEMRAAQDHHISPVAMQMQHEQSARADRNQWANVNHGRPVLAAAPRPLTGPVNSQAHENFAQPNNAPGRNANSGENVAHPTINGRSTMVPARGGDSRPVFDNSRVDHQSMPNPQVRQPQMPARQIAPSSQPQYNRGPQMQERQPAPAPQYRVQQMPQQQRPQSVEPQFHPQAAPPNRPQQMPQYHPQQAPVQQSRPQPEMRQSAPAPQHMERPSGGGRPEGEHRFQR